MNIYEAKMNRCQFMWIAPLAFCVPFTIAFLILKATDFEHSSFEKGMPFGMLVFSVTIVVHLLCTSVPVVRRLNDAGKDRSFVGLLLIPILDVLLLLYLMLLPSTEPPVTRHTNQQT